jgi:hypothetical protein
MDYVNSASPFKIQHDAADAGQECWFRSRWEALSTKQGKWSMARGMIP